MANHRQPEQAALIGPLRRGAYVALAAGIVLALGLVNSRAYRPGGFESARAQLSFLERALDDGAATDMQRMFPEGHVFTWALYGLANAQVAARLPDDDPARAAYLAEAERAAREVRTEQARSTFRRGQRPELGAFYSSWTLYPLAELVRASGGETMDPALAARFVEEADSFAAALDDAQSPFIRSYPGAAWPADVAVGVAALGIHDQVFGPRHAETIAAWVERARDRLDPELGALSHGADPEQGTPWGGVRGSSLALMSRVLVEADRAFAAEQYAILRDRFVDRRLGFVGVREYPVGVEGEGDVDSGPLLLGFSGPAVVVGAAAARAHGDHDLADALQATLEVGGVPIELPGLGRRYGGGLIPVGDAFIAWAWSTPPGPSRPQVGVEDGTRPRPWPLHLVSLLTAVAVVLRARFLLRAQA